MQQMHTSGNLSTHIPAVYDHAQPIRTYALGWLYAKPMTCKTLTNTSVDNNSGIP